MRPHTIGELCIDGDRACTQGDLATLRDIALRLAERLPEPMHCELVELRDACLGSPARAVTLWSELKARLFRPEPAASAAPPPADG